ncbi:diaminobutyrate acetyltransferase [Haloechinothrix sp. LS1_15]|uniref:diaminobutyrate acetyltransferase n=1 Tax=Haloechinothrix sp. LS1_15 TaxID=2652248 RepID=UPI0029456937|nr:diaminobutyrate acetyltransferase [Haloechinothrix sp. LS1_15]MDV6014436.1 diaminobutyrate acetyltransferase [Haloechinothrix sp. LS1_15]
MSEHLEIDHPCKADAAAMWRLARDSGVLDVNSSYAYLLCCHHFAGTSVVARRGGDVVGFLTGFDDPTAEDTVFLWQMAIDVDNRGSGLAGELVDTLATRLLARGTRYLTMSITPGNGASQAVFKSFSVRWNTELHTSRLFESTDFPEDGEHEPEDLYRIGPLTHPPGDVEPSSSA